MEMLFAVLVSFAGLCAVALYLLWKVNKETGETIRAANMDSERASKFRELQRIFFAAFFLAHFGDWLQGPYVYELYASYGFSEGEIGLLFITGFGSSLIVGTFTGPLADKYGRRRMTLFFCLTYSLCCLVKVSANFWVLLGGRVLAGISTSLLFSVFESWYVKQHKDVLMLDPRLVSVTISRAWSVDGVLAIAAGLAAELVAVYAGGGVIAPFILSMICFAACAAVVATTWEENYGSQEGDILQAYTEGLSLILRDRKVFLLGVVQSLFESCMYIFVLLWTPVLKEGSTYVPLGWTFSTFMLAIVIGSLLSILLKARGFTAQDTLSLSTVAFAVCTAVAAVFAGPGGPFIPHKLFCLLAFLGLEASVGMYLANVGSLRADLVPEARRATIANWFRVPMNFFTCATFTTIHWFPAVAADKRRIFAFTTAMLLVGVKAATALKRELVRQR